MMRLALFVIILSVAVHFYWKFQDELNQKRLEEWSELNKVHFTDTNTVISEFKVNFNESEWSFLKLKLEHSRHFRILNEKYIKRNEIGFDPEYAQELTNYWKSDFDWKSRVDYINKYPQFRINIKNEITIHFARILTNSNPNPIKLLLLDGWLGAFFGFYKYIDHIIDNYKNVSFDIVVPSIPGFGYSTPLDKPFDAVDAAQNFDALMRFIHDDQNVTYYIHGEKALSISCFFLLKNNKLLI